MDVFGQAMRWMLETVLPLYRDTGFAYAVAGGMALVALLLALVALFGHMIRSAGLANRTRAMSGFIVFSDSFDAGSDADPQEIQFASRFTDIDNAMRARAIGADRLTEAWVRYRKTLSFVDAPPVRSTQHPVDYFQQALPPPAWLGFAASLFVSFGLLATFLGLIAALSFASEGMASADPGAVQGALLDLLSASSSKFVTSVAGVGLSMILRLIERLLTADQDRRIDRLSASLESGLRVDDHAQLTAASRQLSRAMEKLNGGEGAA